ncbi:hypothetical protein CONPUDRAFT_65852 [Coniophora puteana RWD-64-598 SS2]|uniref:Uncharacterized protein n=1 Tax=Coniophora puteana (strain RWD-64-598) TaxID=741705 RepID=A0A5M3M933_CONPW|nr:uncharacterized protein CONPUDRAFT_65852 [Coniophora puteana RWD-64-598 SS2]EIW75719.1 hypothetical protein CONPUDRAFT_65852 [Coniophora puteana RWD-64-598 SS2]
MAVQYIHNRKYHQALNNLQRLVVLRLMELHKLNIAQTGYKMRTHIAKSLQNRCKAIRTAIKVYNDTAHAIGRPALEWSKVSNHSFLEEFTLLHETRNDIRARAWTQPVMRELMKQSLRVERAEEEILRLNVEVRRLHTAIVDEEREFARVLRDLQQAGNPIYGAVLESCEHRMRVNACVMQRLEDIFALSGFTGSSEVGVRLGSDVDSSTSPAATSRLRGEARGEATPGDDGDAHEPDDDQLQEIGNLVDYITDLEVGS